MTTATITRLRTSPVYAVLPAEDMERAKAFYSDVLGLHVSCDTEPGYCVVHAGGGSEILLYERARTKAEHTVAYFLVDDLDATVAELRERGLSFEEYDTPDLHTVAGIAESPTMRSAWFTDTEGNIISLSELK